MSRYVFIEEKYSFKDSYPKFKALSFSSYYNETSCGTWWHGKWYPPISVEN